MPVGVIKINSETSEVEWFNPYAELIFSTEDGQFDVEELQKVLAIPFENKGHYATIGNKKILRLSRFSSQRCFTF